MADFKKEYKAAMDSVTPDKELLEKLKENMKKELTAPQEKRSFFVMHKTALSAAALAVGVGIAVFAAAINSKTSWNVTSDSSHLYNSSDGSGGGQQQNGIVITLPDDENEGLFIQDKKEETFIETSVDTAISTTSDAGDAALAEEEPAEKNSPSGYDGESDEGQISTAPANIQDTGAVTEVSPISQESEELTGTTPPQVEYPITDIEGSEVAYGTVTYPILKEIAENANEYKFSFYTGFNEVEEYDGYYTVSFTYSEERGDYLITVYTESRNSDTLPFAITVSKYENGSVDMTRGIDLVENGDLLEDYLNGTFTARLDWLFEAKLP